MQSWTYSNQKWEPVEEHPEKDENKTFPEILGAAGYSPYPSFRFGGSGCTVEAYYSPDRFLVIVDDGAGNSWKIYTDGLLSLMTLITKEIEPFLASLSRLSLATQQGQGEVASRDNQRVVSFPAPR